METNLEHMIMHRDAKIASLQSTQCSNNDKIVTLETEVQRLELKLREQEHKHKIEIKLLKGEKETAEQILETYRQDLKDNKALNDYVLLIRNASPNHTDSSHVLRLQSQLTKAIHSVDLMEQQIKALRGSHEYTFKTLKEELNKAIEDRCNVEVDLLNKLAILDNEKRESEKYFKEKLKQRGEDDASIEQKLSNGSRHRCNDSALTDDDEGEDLGENEDELESMRIEIETLISELESVNIEKKSTEAHLCSLLSKKDEEVENLKKRYKDQETVIATLRSEIDVKSFEV